MFNHAGSFSTPFCNVPKKFWSSVAIMNDNNRSSPVKPGVPTDFVIFAKNLIFITSFFVLMSYHVPLCSKYTVTLKFKNSLSKHAKNKNQKSKTIKITYFGSVILINSLASLPMKLTDVESLGGNFGIGIVLL